MPLLLLLILLVLPPASAVAVEPPRCVRGSDSSPGIFGDGRIRAAVIEGHEHDASVFAQVRRLGANMVVTHAAPDGETARLAREDGLFYLAWMSTNDLARTENDPVFRSTLAAVHPLAGIYYEDDSVEEGYATPAVQQRSYDQARRVFPCAIVLHPTRLDPIATDPGFLDRYYRTELTDLVVPYFYPVGTTVLGTYFETDPWQERLSSLVKEIAKRTPSGKGLLPVLQGFEQTGYPVSESFLSDQMRVYAAFWPANRNAAIFEWGFTPADTPLVGFGFRPALRAGAADLFESIDSEPRRTHVIPARP
jgi:hypothetical protein